MAQDYATAVNMEAWLGPRLYDLLDLDAPRNERQTVTINGDPTGGTFTITFNGQTTAGIAYNALASAIVTALELLTTIAAGEVSVTGPNGGPYVVEFISTKGNLPQPEMSADGSSLTGGTNPTATVSQAVAGQAGDANFAANARLIEALANGNAEVEQHIISRYDVTDSAIITHETSIMLARKIVMYNLIITKKGDAGLTEADLEVRRETIEALRDLRDGKAQLTHPAQDRESTVIQTITTEMGSAAINPNNAAGNPTALSPAWTKTW